MFSGRMVWARCGAGGRGFSRESNPADRNEARVFDDLADLETERQCRVVRQEKGLRPLDRAQIAAAARQVGSSISGVSKIWQKFVQLGNSVVPMYPIRNPPTQCSS
jgi:hypothetical protein